MAENKQYIAQEQENGKVMISEDVVTTIIAHAVTEVEGFAGLSENKKNRGKSIKVIISEEDELTIECSVLVAYGYSVVDVAKNTQETVTTAVESITGVKVNAIHVNVCGILRQ